MAAHGEYRTRLIADVVTGKLDVREAAAGLPEVDPLAAEDDPDDGSNPEAWSDSDRARCHRPGGGGVTTDVREGRLPPRSGRHHEKKWGGSVTGCCDTLKL